MSGGDTETRCGIYMPGGEFVTRRGIYMGESVRLMNEARLSHLPFWGPSEAVFFLIKRRSGQPE